MVKRLVTISLLIVFALPTLLCAQQTESQLAYQYYREKEYKKASALFLTLHERTKSQNYFNYYMQCMINLQEYRAAEKIIRKKIKRYPNDNYFLIELGYLYKLTNRPDQMKEKYQQAIKKLLPVDSDIKSLARIFTGKREYEYAILTYQKGRQLRKAPHLYHFEMANVFLSQRNFELMLNEYFDALSIDSSLLSQVQSRLQSALSQDINASLDTLLRTRLLERIQKQDHSAVFHELLFWYFIQKKNFANALRYGQALDIRLGKNSWHLLNLAQVAVSNKEYTYALEAYKHIIQQGPAFNNYIPARIGELNARFLTFKDQEKKNAHECLKLKNDFLTFLDEVELSPRTLPAVLQLAHLQAFWLQQFPEAFSLLTEAQKIRGLSFALQTDIKMKLADIKLLANEGWEAILLYTQIEKSNRNNPSGYEAKFKKAKVAYYMGDLNWAQAQLETLKGSTSKFIANDALALSQLIRENTGLDSTARTMKLYARADYLHYQRKDSLALLTLDSLIVSYPGHSLLDESYYKKYEIYLSIQNYSKALEALDYILESYPYEILADQALFKRAKLYERLKQFDKAMESYEQILNQYPESIFVIESRNQFRKLRGN